ncbi:MULTISPECIES: hypothetical protein [Mycobacterium]|nr:MULTISPECIES: hypothetical protein [Mycobacterium]WRU84794.1 hypothetical protein P6281_05315 [Mycobacterium sp. 5-140-3-2]WVL50710.1 hypothetical protein KN248_002530 [Mycobacterium paraintracellulare]
MHVSRLLSRLLATVRTRVLIALLV